MLTPIPLAQIVVRLLVALVCGAVLGWEREAQGKPAGFRTNILIALGAAAYTLVTLGMFASVAGQSDTARADILRLVQGIVGFAPKQLYARHDYANADAGSWPRPVRSNGDKHPRYPIHRATARSAHG